MAKTPLGKRVNKKKDEIVADMKHKEKVARDIMVAKLLFSFMKDLPTIYDAQTALNAMSGYIKWELKKKTTEFKVKDLGIDLKDEPESEIKTVVASFIGQLENENAEEMGDFLEKYAGILSKYGSAKYLENPMSIIKMEDLIK